MAEADSFESKRRIDDTLIVVIEQAREKVADHFYYYVIHPLILTQISPFVTMITEPLPSLCMRFFTQMEFH